MEEHSHALTYLAIVMAAAFMGGALFRKLKQPVLVGYIIVGLILGPAMFGVVSSRDEVSLMAELGILLLLFIVGLEMDLKSFKSVSKMSLITCGFQIALSLGAMLAVGFFFNWPLNQSILFGFAFSLSSTAVALKILEEKGMRGVPVGQKCVGILIAQDLAVIPMILIIGALNTGGEFNYMGIARLFIAVLLLGLLMYLLTKKPAFFTKFWGYFESAKASAMKGQAAITALAFCFAAAAVAGLCGLSPAYGAFLAGIALGHTRSSHQLEEHIKPIFDVMIMIFFLSIGLLIDLEFMRENWVVCTTLLFTTLFIKTVMNVVILRLQKVEKNEAYMLGAVLAQVGEFSFILAAMGLAANAIDGEAYKYVVSTITLSLLATPFWLYIVKKRHVDREVLMASSPHA